jgi:hypothetical protein
MSSGTGTRKGGGNGFPPPFDIAQLSDSSDQTSSAIGLPPLTIGDGRPLGSL